LKSIEEWGLIYFGINMSLLTSSTVAFNLFDHKYNFNNYVYMINIKMIIKSNSRN
jgi:hypothetical protein